MPPAHFSSINIRPGSRTGVPYASESSVSSPCVFVKGDAESAAVKRGKGFALVGQENCRTERLIIMQKIIDFRRDLTLYGTVPPSGKPIGRFLLTQWEPAFIDGVFILLLQLRKHDAIRSDPTVAADAELFLINRLV